MTTAMRTPAVPWNKELFPFAMLFYHLTDRNEMVVFSSMLLNRVFNFLNRVFKTAV